jgi:hypothetical protein
LLYEREHSPLSQLPYGHRRDHFIVCIIVLHTAIDLFGTLFFQGGAILGIYASTRDGGYCRRARDDVDSAPAHSAAARRVLLTIGSARLESRGRVLERIRKGGPYEISSFDCYFGSIHRYGDSNVAGGRLLSGQRKMLPRQML